MRRKDKPWPINFSEANFQRNQIIIGTHLSHHESSQLDDFHTRFLSYGEGLSEVQSQSLPKGTKKSGFSATEFQPAHTPRFCAYGYFFLMVQSHLITDWLNHHFPHFSPSLIHFDVVLGHPSSKFGDDVCWPSGWLLRHSASKSVGSPVQHGNFKSLIDCKWFAGLWTCFQSLGM